MHRKKKPQENKASTIVECGLGQNGKHNVKDDRKRKPADKFKEQSKTTKQFEQKLLCMIQSQSQ